MDTEVMESRLTKVCSFFTTHVEGTNVQDVVNELRSCERELVAHRFARAKASDGRPIRVRVPAVDAALIHVSRALSRVRDGSQVEQARASAKAAAGGAQQKTDSAELAAGGESVLRELRESVEHAREEVAHIPAFA